MTGSMIKSTWEDLALEQELWFYFSYTTLLVLAFKRKIHIFIPTALSCLVNKWSTHWGTWGVRAPLFSWWGQGEVITLPHSHTVFCSGVSIATGFWVACSGGLPWDHETRKNQHDSSGQFHFRTSFLLNLEISEWGRWATAWLLKMSK
jgi:hypothetical protein